MRRVIVVLAASVALLANTACGFTFTVKVNESGFDPFRQRTSDQNDEVNWTNTGSVPHTATSFGNGAFFDTGDIAPAATSSNIAFESAGLFRYFDKHSTKHQGRVYVPLEVTSDASRGDTITVIWADSPFTGSYAIPAGFHADVQARQPGDSRWHNWRVNQTGSNTFANAVVKHRGIYRFRARYVKDGVVASNYTPPAICNVT